MTMLAALLREHGGPVRADVRQTYGLDIYDLYRGTLDPMEAWDLVTHLPPGSRLWRALGGPGEWEPMEWWAALTVDVLREANWQRTEEATRGVNHPRPLPRPTAAPVGSKAKADAASVALDRAAVFRARQAAQEKG